MRLRKAIATMTIALALAGTAACGEPVCEDDEAVVNGQCAEWDDDSDDREYEDDDEGEDD